MRYSNFDILRSLCAIMVIVEHFCETGMIGAFGMTNGCLASDLFLAFSYSFSRCAVDVFVMLSGYFLISAQNQRLGKVVSLTVMTVFYAEVLYGLALFFSIGQFSIKQLILYLLPRKYYLYLYCATYILSPYINQIVLKLSKNQYKILLCIMFILFSGWSTFANIITNGLGISLQGIFFTSLNGTDMGFNIINFIFLYLIGGYIRLFLNNVDKAKKKRMGAIGVLCCVVVTALLKLVYPRIATVLLYYDSFILIIQTISLVLLFDGFEGKPNELIQKIGEKGYAVFLAHGSVLIILQKYVDIRSMIGHGFGGTCLAFVLFVFGGYLVSLLIAFVLQFLYSPVSNWWKKNRSYSVTFFQNK